MRRVTIEEAEKRMRTAGRNYSVVEWNGTNKPAIIKHDVCGFKMEKHGGSLWKPENRYFTFGDCKMCKIKHLMEKFKAYNEAATKIFDGEYIDKISNVKDVDIYELMDMLDFPKLECTKSFNIRNFFSYFLQRVCLYNYNGTKGTITIYELFEEPKQKLDFVINNEEKWKGIYEDLLKEVDSNE